MRSRIAAVLVVSACVTGRGVVAPAPPPRHTVIALAISGFRASDGLRIVLVPDPKATEVEVTMRYRVGDIDDPPGQDGMAHLVEHLMFMTVSGGQSLWAK
ncbi:MAG TPA: insulinase family protein, partial [Kofleriaceae bacterium]|nr:insulinase family protein [Kofleriaceae bacterium]